MAKATATTPMRQAAPTFLVLVPRGDRSARATVAAAVTMTAIQAVTPTTPIVAYIRAYPLSTPPKTVDTPLKPRPVKGRWTTRENRKGRRSRRSDAGSEADPALNGEVTSDGSNSTRNTTATARRRACAGGGGRPGQYEEQHRRHHRRDHGAAATREDHGHERRDRQEQQGLAPGLSAVAPADGGRHRQGKQHGQHPAVLEGELGGALGAHGGAADAERPGGNVGGVARRHVLEEELPPREPGDALNEPDEDGRQDAPDDDVHHLRTPMVALRPGPPRRGSPGRARRGRRAGRPRGRPAAAPGARRR